MEEERRKNPERRRPVIDTTNPDSLLNFFVSTELDRQKEVQRITEHLEKTRKLIFKVVIVFCSTLFLVVGMFFLFLLQFNFESTQNIQSTGVYNLVDSEGNVIASDVDPETLKAILEAPKPVPPFTE